MGEEPGPGSQPLLMAARTRGDRDFGDVLAGESEPGDVLEDEVGEELGRGSQPLLTAARTRGETIVVGVWRLGVEGLEGRCLATRILGS